ncbi:MAG: SOS response-associated peptidase [Acidimicrobiia bacterium]|nr:SOS response-associated peptidase [Acidimicrobiia bacterium]MYG58026.1 SOS response-associated peptidase [Acidimicrobiia bacterium]MYJ32515.1 SOS response-associated peptidase [Acidimicrobiia bacterium]
MCGRYSLTASLQELAQRFEFDGEPEGFVPRYNVSPTQQVLTVIGGDARKAGFMRWGLIPSWSKDGPSSRPLINARAETVAEKPSFRGPLKNRRCLVPADGFYEWQKVGDAKRPMRITMRSGELFAFAGLWSMWTDPEGNRIPSCAIITTAANDVLKPIHHRMPVILAEEAEDIWLDTALDDSDALSQLLEPYPDDALEAYEVSRLVNSASNDVPEVTEPLPQLPS